MDAIEQREKRIRDLVNHPWKLQALLDNKAKWNKLCASMDVIGDTQMAINDFFALPSFSSHNGGFLFLYGLLQAMFLQQDAINHLSEALFSKSINWKNDYPDIFHVRELRNISIGHPTNRGNDKSFHFVGRYSISNEEFRMMSYYSELNKNIFQVIKIQELKKKQEDSVIEILDNLIDLMEEEYKKHKMQFTDMKISKLTTGMGYSVSKVYEGIYNNYPLAEACFSIIKSTIDTVKKEIEKRYGKLSALQGVEDVIRRIDYIIGRMEGWFNEYNIFKNKDAEVFMDSLSDRINELEIMLKEIDEEFNKT